MPAQPTGFSDVETEDGGVRAPEDSVQERTQRASAIAEHAGLGAALAAGAIPTNVVVSVSEAIVLGLLAQDVTSFVGIFGHGTTDLGEVLRVYELAGAVRVYAVRNEVEAAHAASALRMTTGEKAAVFTSIGPGALQAMAGSLAAAADGVGVWHIYADETTEDEGPNMQQLPGGGQERFLKLMSSMGPAYSLHTPWALPEALRRGLNAVDHPHRGAPFYLLLPINVQPQEMRLNLNALPTVPPPALGAAHGDYAAAAAALRDSERVIVKVGGGAREAGPQLGRLLELIDGFAVVSPMALGVIPASHPRNMGVGGSKGTISGNFAMENGDTLLVIGSRGVCQADMSRTGYPSVRKIVNINTDLDDVVHYNHTIPLYGAAALTIERLIAELLADGATPTPLGGTAWSNECTAARAEWSQFVSDRTVGTTTLVDEMWGREILTQPAAIATVTRWARSVGAVCYFDAGDVQANGFQIADDDRLGRTVTETGASYMGFASSALLATAMTEHPYFGVALTGDGSFTMNPQILIDGVEHGARGVVVLFDNRRQGAISSLQRAQYGVDFATNDGVQVDYAAWAASIEGVLGLHGGYTTESLKTALEASRAHDGLSLIHVPVYFGEHELGGVGSFGRWNVGSWVGATQALRHEVEI